MGSVQLPIIMINSALAKVAQVCKLTPVLLDEIRAHAASDPEHLSLRKAIEDTSGKLVNGDLTVKDGDVFYKERWYIPNHRELKLKILSSLHDSKIAGHFGQFKTAERLRALFYWPKMDDDMEEYVRSCDTCQRDKASRHKKYGMLQPLEVPYTPRSSISMDFIVSLPESEGYTRIWVIVDRFTKMSHFIPLKTRATIEELAHIFLREIWRLHGLPEEIISDRDSRFESKFWDSLMKLLGVKLRLSTAYRPQTDGQTERVNQTLEQYLRNYCSYQQDDWAGLLPLAEYAYNTATQESTKVSPFYANYGFQPDSTWPSPKRKLDNVDASSAVLESKWKTLWEAMRADIHKAQARQKKWYDQKPMKAPELKAGDKVMLDRRNIITKRPSNKLDHQKIGSL